MKNSIDWKNISAHQKLSEDFIRENVDKVNWNYISAYQKLSEDFIRENQDKVDWDYISKNQKLSEDFIREFQDKVNWCWISIYQSLSEDFIREFQDKIDWALISKYQKLSFEDFIREFQDKVNWIYISANQKLSEEFIREFQDKVNWKNISRYQKLSFEGFMKEFNLKKPKNNWLYTSKKKKLEYIKNHTDYEVIDNEYIIVYKSCRSDRYSRFNFQYRYEVGKTYESHCDCNLREEDSFGLSAWTKEGALSYCNEKLFKVKINIEDIGAIVHNNNKIRCFRLTILEEVKI